MSQVVLVYALWRETYTSKTYATLLPICAGFMMAAVGDPQYDEYGFTLALGSTLLLVVVNMTTRKMLTDFKGRVDPLQAQAWTTAGSFFLLMPLWIHGGGVERLNRMLAGDKAMDFVSIVGIDGVAYHMANIGTFTSIGVFEPLSFAIIDTLRRLMVVCSGFIYQGNVCTLTNIVGIVLVIVGAGLYNVFKTPAAVPAAVTAAEPWTNDEDRILQQAHAELGKKWIEVAKRLPGRSNNACRNRSGKLQRDAGGRRGRHSRSPSSSRSAK